MKKWRVLIVDDSAAVRAALSELVASDPALEVMATASDPFQAVERIRQERPDVITLDVEMPQMDGVTFLRRIMSQHPIPVVMCSTLMEENSKPLLDALEAGAVDCICKPKLGARDFFEQSRAQICETLKAAATARPRPRARFVPQRKLTADEVLPQRRREQAAASTGRIIAIGASTGGTEALATLLSALPAQMPPIVIVQHMPAAFTRSFAERLNAISALSVAEARHGDMLEDGRALVAPGGIHCIVQGSGGRARIELRDGPLVARHKPSVDVLFRSVARSAGKAGTGVILTGMGDDGARGLKEMAEAGARTIGQDEATSVVYGMPKAAFQRGAVQVQLALDRIAPRLAGG